MDGPYEKVNKSLLFCSVFIEGCRSFIQFFGKNFGKERFVIRRIFTAICMKRNVGSLQDGLQVSPNFFILSKGWGILSISNRFEGSTLNKLKNTPQNRRLRRAAL